jgi:hypothetical protein
MVSLLPYGRGLFVLGGLTVFSDDALLVRLGGEGRPARYHWIFGIFLAADRTPMHPTYAEVQRSLGQHGSEQRREYVTRRPADPMTRFAF